MTFDTSQIRFNWYNNIKVIFKEKKTMMRNKLSNGFLGLAFVAIGCALLGNIFFDWNFTIFFDGWWTLFIIIPCVYSMLRTGINSYNFV